MSVKEKTPAAPDAVFPSRRGEGHESGSASEKASFPRFAGYVLIVAGISLMLLSGWAPGGLFP